MDRECVNAAGQFGGQNPVDHAMTFDPALPAERLRYDMNAEMSLAARPMPSMAFMAMRFILDIEALRRKRGGKLFGDPGFDLHDGFRRRVLPFGQLGRGNALFQAPPGKTICQDLKVDAAPSHNVRS